MCCIISDDMHAAVRQQAAACAAMPRMVQARGAQIWGRCVASANSPLALARRGVQQYLDLGVPAGKLVLGLPWCARRSARSPEPRLRARHVLQRPHWQLLSCMSCQSTVRVFQAVLWRAAKSLSMTATPQAV